MEPRDYHEVLRLMNNKSALGIVAKSLGFSDKERCVQHVVARLARGDGKMLAAVHEHLPSGVPRSS